MGFKRYTRKVIAILIIAICLVTGCEKIPTQMITTESIDKVAIATISEMDDIGKLIMIHETGDTFLTHPHAQPMNMQTDMNMETVQPHFHPPGTPAHSHANAQATIPTILPGGGAKIGCGLIKLTK